MVSCVSGGIGPFELMHLLKVVCIFYEYCWRVIELLFKFYWITDGMMMLLFLNEFLIEIILLIIIYFRLDDVNVFQSRLLFLGNRLLQ